ncbi:carbonic anhydrase [Paracoccus sp. (in: a-proteobacteria)]|uniref:carbonic anhydrase n=1 Tax=Paracoccus sp. TaxID=267 RepID=UPI002AFFB0F7|nr:carbonic anhydrase [Paracoccus sp. (in: a-proteobacteria)]
MAGNFVNTYILGSLEFATEVAGARAIVILGHTSCGAIKSAVDGVELGNITAMLKNFDPALATLEPADGERSSANGALVQKVADQNALLTAASLVQRSDILARRMAEGTLAIAAAMHDINTGRITWLG